MSDAPLGAVSGAPRAWLRLEGVAVVTIATLLYSHGGHSWLLFAIGLLAPDLSLIAYLGGARIGAAGYNIVHSYVGPAAAAAIALVTGSSPAIALIWAAHIGIDRALGYGLKYPSDFGATHLGRLRGGRARTIAPAG